MTAGLVCMAIGVGTYALALSRAVGQRAGIAALTCGVATLGVALVPLGSSDALDAVHGVLAGIGYVSLAAIPALAARELREAGHRGAARASVAAGAVALACLAATLAGPASGLFQRVGLGVVDAWLVVSALWLVRAHPAPAETTSAVW